MKQAQDSIQNHSEDRLNLAIVSVLFLFGMAVIVLWGMDIHRNNINGSTAYSMILTSISSGLVGFLAKRFTASGTTITGDVANVATTDAGSATAIDTPPTP